VPSGEASEEVIIQLVVQNYSTILLYGRPITISAAKSFDFVMNMFLNETFSNKQFGNY
jgi:hypothetical protein